MMGFESQGQIKKTDSCMTVFWMIVLTVVCGAVGAACVLSMLDALLKMTGS